MASRRHRWALLTAAAFCCVGAAPPADRVIARIDLSKPFNLAKGASFTATQAPDEPDPMFPGEMETGKIHLCIRTAVRAPCTPDLDNQFAAQGADGYFSEIHDLHTAEVVFPRGTKNPPLIHLQYGSRLSGDGDEVIAALILAYRPRLRRFEVVFREPLGHNNNQELRFIKSGPLTGDVISVHPTGGAPFGYWITVSKLSHDYRYKQVLRYRSATHYGDGNPLAVIDSEMPNILRRLGLWHRGDPLPLPKVLCAHPHLVKMELWCS